MPEKPTISLDGGVTLGKEGYLLRSLMENLEDRIYFKDLQSRILYGNHAYAKLFNQKSFSEIVGKTDFDFFSAFHAQAAFDDEQDIIRTGKPKLDMEEMETWPDGRVTWCSTSKAPLLDDEGRIIGTLGISRDITARKNAQEALIASEAKYRQVSVELVKTNKSLMEVARAAEEACEGLAATLAEKDVLLNEVHHRVRNSLQIVLSIVSLYARRETNPTALATYSSVLDRIRAISSVHNRLFDLDSEQRIDLPEYMEDLIRHFDENYGHTGARFQFDAEPIWVPMDLCLDLGLVLTELVLHLLGRVDLAEKNDLIRVRIGQEADNVLLTVAAADFGIPEDLSSQEAKTVGIGIILSMVSQRGGTLSLVPDSKRAVQVRVPLGQERLKPQWPPGMNG